MTPEESRARHRERMATDSAYAERKRQAALRAYRKRSPDRDAINTNWRAADERRRAADPDYQARRLARQNERRRERLADDPNYRERHRVDRVVAMARKRFSAQPLARFFHREIRAFYANCPSIYTVDHIEPLFTVREGVVIACGLHVPWNLQYLTLADNVRKANASVAEKS